MRTPGWLANCAPVSPQPSSVTSAKRASSGSIAANNRPPFSGARRFSTISRRRPPAGGKGKAEDKFEAMRSAGIAVADSPASLGTTLLKALKR